MIRFCRSRCQVVSHGFSLLEMLAAITILGIVAALVVPRFGNQGAKSKGTACGINKNNIEVQVQLWYRNKGTWPATNMNDIGANRTYFPDVMPTCPVDGSAYQLDSTTHRVVGHVHP